MRNGLIGVISLISCLLWPEPGSAEPVYKFGVVPQFEARKLFTIWQPILAELERRTGLRFRMVGSAKIPVFEAAFMKGNFDFAYMTPYHAMLAGEEQGCVPLVRDGGRPLFGILVVPKDSPITEVKQLDGKTVAFPAANALGASLLIRADLTTIHRIAVKPVYVQTHSSVYLNVRLGRMAAGGGVASTFARQPRQIRDGLRILYRTRTIAPHPVTAHPRVSKLHRERVRRAFITLGQSATGAAMLAKVPFKDIVPAGMDDYLEFKYWGLERYYVQEKPGKGTAMGTD